MFSIKNVAKFPKLLFLGSILIKKIICYEINSNDLFGYSFVTEISKSDLMADKRNFTDMSVGCFCLKWASSNG